MATLTLVSQDDAQVPCDRECLRYSSTLRNLLEDVEDANSDIPLPKIENGKVLTKVIEYLNDLHQFLSPLKEEEKRSFTIFEHQKLSKESWILKYTCPGMASSQDSVDNLDQYMLYQLMIVALYLDITSLLDVTCRQMAMFLKNRSPEEIKKMFGVEKNENE